MTKTKSSSNTNIRRACLVGLVTSLNAVSGASSGGSSCFYQILGIDRTATQQQITKAYRRKSLQTHPDKNDGDRTEYDAIREAHDCLGDEGKRRMYDRYGTDGLNDSFVGGHHGAGASAAADMFRSFFYGGPGGSSDDRGRYSNQRQRSMKYQLEVTLEDLYNGLNRSIAIAQPGAPNKTVHVHVDRGSHDGQRVVLPGEIDYLPNIVPGDVIFIL